MTLRTVISGTAVTIGLAAGMLGSTGVASANTLANLGLGVVLPTSTNLTLTSTAQQGDATTTVTETATVTLQAINSAFITPSGSVQFEAVEYPSDGDQMTFPDQNVSLSRCLLGLAPVAGLWQKTCSATATVTLARDVCGTAVFLAEYSGSSDLLAGPSESNRPTLTVPCAS
jgi:hypothetical protein